MNTPRIPRDSTLHVKLDRDLPVQQRQVLVTYQGGYISLGRLARAMGMHALELRPWLRERGLSQEVAYGDDDAANA